MGDTVLTSTAKGKEIKFVCSYTTHDTGWHVLLDRCPEERGSRFILSRVCQHQDLEFDASGHEQLGACISTVCVCVCLCTSYQNYLASLLMNSGSFLFN